MQWLVEVGLWNAAAAAVLAVAAAAASRVARRPALAHALWLLVLLKLVTPPVVPFRVPWPEPEEVATAAAPVDLPDADLAGPEGPLPAEDEVTAGFVEPAEAVAAPAAFPWAEWAAAAWLGGSALWFGWVAVQVRRFGRLLRHARRADAALQAEAEALAARLGLRRCPPVWVVPGAVSPMVWSVGRAPCLLFPAALLGRLEAEGRAALLAHELAHVRRGDHRVRLLEVVVAGLYWWCPVVWWARHRLREAEEECCDAWVVWALEGNARAYALALVQAVTFVSEARSALPAGASGIGPVPSLKRRLHMILNGKTPRALSWFGLSAVLGLGLLLLPLFPARGQPPAPKSADEPGLPRKQSREEQIEALKRALELLEKTDAAEEKRAVEALKAYRAAVQRKQDVAKDADVEALHADAAKLKVTIEMRRRELADLEAKYAAVTTKLKELSEKPRESKRKEAPDSKKGEAGADKKGADIEMRLDRLMKEIEELRKEMRGKKSDNAPAK
jgi:beta-lactamase regulating signal transducer with metallopeptidase domain